MAGSAASSGLIARLLCWIKQVGARKVVSPAVSQVGRLAALPALFAVRSTPRTPIESREAILRAAIERVKRFAFAGRLRAVMLQNAPKALKSPRRRLASPASKPLPKRQARVLKSYKPARGNRFLPAAKLMTAGAEIIPLRSQSRGRSALLDRHAA
jgi:hypothetical protein